MLVLRHFEVIKCSCDEKLLKPFSRIFFYQNSSLVFIWDIGRLLSNSVVLTARLLEMHDDQC